MIEIGFIPLRKSCHEEKPRKSHHIICIIFFKRNCYIWRSDSYVFRDKGQVSDNVSVKISSLKLVLEIKFQRKIFRFAVRFGPGSIPLQIFEVPDSGPDAKPLRQSILTGYQFFGTDSPTTIHTTVVKDEWRGEMAIHCAEIWRA